MTSRDHMMGTPLDPGPVPGPAYPRYPLAGSGAMRPVRPPPVNPLTEVLPMGELFATNADLDGIAKRRDVIHARIDAACLQTGQLFLALVRDGHAHEKTPGA